MRFKKLTEENKFELKKIYYDKSLTWSKRIKIAITKFNVDERTIRRWWKKLDCRTLPEFDSQQYEIAKLKELDKTKKVFIISWAQNNTPVHKNFFNNMVEYAKFRDASIHIIAGRYKNPTSVHIDKKYDVWDDNILEYLDAKRHNIHKSLTVLSDVKIQPTATDPLSGMAGFSGRDSCIFGHPRVHMEVVPSLEGYFPKIMWTTGACTIKNYTDSKAGKKGEFHHVLGFVIVEIQDDLYHVRQVTAKEDGNFCDLFYEVKDGKISEISEIEGLILGDIHLGDTDYDILNCIINDFCKKIKPKYTVCHDIFNGHSINHHEKNDPIKKYEKILNNKHSLKNEIDDVLSWIENHLDLNLVIVRSNHDDFLDRWIIDADWKKDLFNSIEYLEYSKILLSGKAKKGLLPYLITDKFKNKVITLGIDESFTIKGWECGHHGHLGINGSYGSIQQFRKLNTKIITGHTHSPARKDGVLTVGTCTKLRVGYNNGASNWLNSFVIIHKNGKAQHINLFKNSENKVMFTNLNY